MRREGQLREAVLSEARDWIGTPYRHQASVKGAGCDCLGLVRGVWRAVLGAEPEAPGAYRPDWAERGGAEALLTAARRHLLEMAPPGAPGDVVLFRLAPGCPAKHCAIFSGPDRIIHAWHGRAVCETSLGPWWRRRIAGVFAFQDNPEELIHGNARP